MYTNHEDVGCMSAFTKECCITQHIHHTTNHRDLVPNNTYFRHHKSTRISALANQTLIQQLLYLRTNLKLKRYGGAKGMPLGGRIASPPPLKFNWIGLLPIQLNLFPTTHIKYSHSACKITKLPLIQN